MLMFHYCIVNHLYKKVNTVLNLKIDKIKMFNKNVDFKLSSSWHYAVNILPNDASNFYETKANTYIRTMH